MTISCSSFYKSSTAIPLIFGLGLSAASAADVTITTAVTVQQTVADGGTLTITESGSVTSPASAAVIGTVGGTITIINNGALTGVSDGINAVTIANLTNSGTITGKGNEGIVTTGSVTINNLATGKIIADSDGIHAGSNSMVTNAGLITGGDEGVQLGSNSKVINSGKIIGGSLDNAIEISGMGMVTNSGTVSGGVGIDLGSGSITNSGTVTGTSGTAINFTSGGTANTVTLHSGSILFGQIKWDGTGDTLNLGKGLDTEVTLNNAAANVNFGTGVGVNNGTTVVQVDVTGSSLAGGHGFDVGQATNGVVNARIGAAGSNSFGNTSNGVGYSFADGNVERSMWGSLWAMGSTQKPSGTLSAATSASVGATSGIDWLDSEGNLLGFHGGTSVGHVNVDVTNGQAIDTQSYVGGIYGSKTNGNLVLDFNISAGMINLDSTRHVSTNNGIKTAKASYNGILFAPEFTLSRESDAGFTPSIGLGYTGLFLEGYTETGSSSSNITMGSRAIHYATAKAQVEFNKDITNDDGKTTMFRPYLGLEGKAGFGDVNTGTITVAGSTLNFDTGSDKNTARGFAGINFSKGIAENTKFFGNVEVGYNSSKSFDGRLSLGLSKTF